MDIYLIAVFTHIVGALGLFVALGMEWLTLRGLGGASNRDRALEWLGVMSIVRRLGAASFALIVVPGLYMAAIRWGFGHWTGAALLGFAGLLALGGLFTGRTAMALERAIIGEQGQLSPHFRQLLQTSGVRHVLWTRVGLALGIVGLMVAKPDLVVSLVVLALAAALGYLGSVAIGRQLGGTAVEADEAVMAQR